MEGQVCDQPHDELCHGNAAVAVEDAGLSMNAFPDEILLMVFANIDDGATLLDSVSLVCKRWRRLSRDPASWVGSRLTVGQVWRGNEAVDGWSDVADEARILLHAPAAKSLQISSNGYFSPGHTPTEGHIKWMREQYGHEACRRLSSALRRTRVVVSESVRYDVGGWVITVETETEPEASVVCLLKRHRDLLELDVYVSKCGDTAILTAVAQLRHLKKLKLTMAADARYNGELASALPELHDLRFFTLLQSGALTAQPALSLLEDLVHSARGLRLLHTDLTLGSARLADACAVLHEHGLESVGFKLYHDGMRALGVEEACDLLFEIENPAFKDASIWLLQHEWGGTCSQGTWHSLERHEDSLSWHCKTCYDRRGLCTVFNADYSSETDFDPSDLDESD